MELQIARNLWRQCFHDPEAYEEFYFDNVYPNNRVYFEEDKGMLHLNPYLCHVGMKERILHYIVGVATDERYRRCGIMRNLLQRALLDMREEQEPFTYLMPADVRYYEPFGFVSAKEEERCEIGIAQLSAAQSMPYSFWHRYSERWIMRYSSVIGWHPCMMNHISECYIRKRRVNREISYSC